MGVALIVSVWLLPEGDGRRTRRCDFRAADDEDFVVGERVLVGDVSVCDDEFSRVVSAALMIAGI